VRSLAALLLVGIAATAHAHQRDLSYVDVREQDRTLVLAIDVDPHDTPLYDRIDRDRDNVITAAEIAAQHDALVAFILGRVTLKKVGQACTMRTPPKDEFYADVQMWHVEAIFDCPSDAAGYTLYLGHLDALSRGHRAMLKVVSDGKVKVQTVLEPRHAIVEPRAVRWLETGARFVALGVHHIFDGLDHLAFVLALILAATSLRRALLLLSAFTVAHSVTLLLSAFQIVRLPEKPVEVTIALSIAVVAIETLRAQDRLWLRTALAFGFGLVHGLGFASVLADALFSTPAFLWSLLSFNVGIELGQACLVVSVLPGLLAVEKRPWHYALAAAVPLPIAAFASVQNGVLVGAFIALLLALSRWHKPMWIASAVLATAGVGWAIARLLSL
jgi:hypothetical protein